MRCFLIDKAILFKKLFEPSLFLLIHGQNNHLAWSVKIALQSMKSQGKVRDFFAPVGGNCAVTFPVECVIHPSFSGLCVIFISYHYLLIFCLIVDLLLLSMHK